MPSVTSFFRFCLLPPSSSSSEFFLLPPVSLTRVGVALGDLVPLLGALLPFLYVFMNSEIRSGQSRFFSGSHVLCLLGMANQQSTNISLQVIHQCKKTYFFLNQPTTYSEKPFHLRKYSTLPFTTLLSKTFSTTYSSSSEDADPSSSRFSFFFPMTALNDLFSAHKLQRDCARQGKSPSAIKRQLIKNHAEWKPREYNLSRCSTNSKRLDNENLD